jgi:plastocyanin
MKKSRWVALGAGLLVLMLGTGALWSRFSRQPTKPDSNSEAATVVAGASAPAPAPASAPIVTLVDTAEATTGVAYETKAAANTGQLTGVVKFKGKAPSLPPVKHTKDLKVCGENNADDSLQVDDKGGLANAIVSLNVPAGPKKMAPTSTPSLDQKDCRFIPRVQAFPAGSTFTLLSSDPVLHTVHGWTGADFDVDVFNKAMPLKGVSRPVTIAKPGLISIKCDTHNWMQAWVLVTDNPYYAVTGADGSFKIDELPPGEYTGSVWHEKFGKQDIKVTIPAKSAANLEVSFPVDAGK